MHPRVSVVTIFLNAEQFLSDAIQSVLDQEFDDFELFLVDDGSTDGSSELARDYARRFPTRVRYLEHSGHANRGMSASRNLGIQAARGEFVAFIDADDAWERQKLSEQVAILDSNPDVGMVCGAVHYWRSWAGGEDRLIRTGHLQNRQIPCPEAALALYPLGTAAAPCPSDVMLRRETVSNVGGFEEHFTGAKQMYEDQAFFAKVYLSTPVYFSDKAWLWYRQHDESCVAAVKRAGQYHEVRAYFLRWLSDYIRRVPECDPRIQKAVMWKLRRYRSPYVHQAISRLEKAAQLARATKRQILLSRSALFR